MKSDKVDDVLNGTTRKVFKFLYRQGNPAGVREIQRGLGLSSPSLVYYHLNKLLAVGLIREDSGGYVAEKRLFDNMVRIRRKAIPVNTASATFFMAALAILLLVLRPLQLTGGYIFALVVIAVAFFLSLHEVYRNWKAID